MLSLYRYALLEHPNRCLSALAFALAFISLDARPTCLGLILLLATLQLHARIIVPRPNRLWRFVVCWYWTTVGVTLAHIGPSLHALSSASGSIFALLLLSGVTSLLALLLIFLDARLSGRMGSRWAWITLFPAAWATLWCVISHISPIGRLVTWSPVLGVGPYRWLAPFTGRVGIDWVVAAWAVVVSETIGATFMGAPPEDDHAHGDLMSFGDETGNGHSHAEGSKPSESARQSSSTLTLAILLGALAIPGFVMNDLPVPVASLDTTPLTVGCALPSPVYPNRKDETPLDEYISTSQKMTSAHVILWPEGAIRFDNAEERNAALDRVRNEIRGPHVGVAFEEYLPKDSPNGDGRTGKKLNGLALVGAEGVSLTYYKRNLVPIAESYSFARGRQPPEISALELTAPKERTKTDWNPEAPHVRPIPLTASICLDFTSPEVFSALPSRPALILAPGRTWHSAVSLAMWEQARARAAELDTAVLWCDGGDGGVSGVAGKGMHEIMQVGDGYWTRTIGIPWQFDERRSVYARVGVGADVVVLVIAWIICFGGAVGQRGAQRGIMSSEGRSMVLENLGRFRRAIQNTLPRRRGAQNAEQQRLLD